MITLRPQMNNPINKHYFEIYVFSIAHPQTNKSISPYRISTLFLLSFFPIAVFFQKRISKSVLSWKYKSIGVFLNVYVITICSVSRTFQCLPTHSLISWITLPIHCTIIIRHILFDSRPSSIHVPITAVHLPYSFTCKRWKMHRRWKVSTFLFLNCNIFFMLFT